MKNLSSVLILICLCMLSCNSSTESSTEKYSITLNQALHGIATVTPVKSEYLYGDTVIFAATPDTKYEFVNWQIINPSTATTKTFTDNPYTYYANGNISATPVFQEKYVISTNTTQNGSIKIEPLKTLYSNNEEVLITAVPNDLYAFSSWNGSLSGNNNPKKMNINTDLVIGASFVYSPNIDINFTQNSSSIFTDTGTMYYLYSIDYSCTNIGNVPAKITQFDISLFSKINDSGSGYSVTEKTISFTYGNYISINEVSSGKYHAYCILDNNVHAYKVTYTFSDGTTEKSNIYWGSI